MKDFKQEAEEILGHDELCKAPRSEIYECTCGRRKKAEALYQLHLESLQDKKVREAKFTKAEINQLISCVEERDRGDDYGWYYGNKEQFEKRHKSILEKLKK